MKNIGKILYNSIMEHKVFILFLYSCFSAPPPGLPPGKIISKAATFGSVRPGKPRCIPLTAIPAGSGLPLATAEGRQSA
jgi:hypothetical protein